MKQQRAGLCGKGWISPRWLAAGFIDPNNNNQRVALQRDKDIPRLVDRLGGIGLMGSDAWLTQNPSLRARLASTPLLVLEGVRFALAALEERAPDVRRKRQSGEPLTVAAVYPALARAALGQDTVVISLTEGGLEALPKLMPELDGTFDLVESGQTADENDLVIIEDNLVPVTLDAVWPAGQGAWLNSAF
ncbi:MAG TPA: hypothetical protein VLH86_06075 [Patescibacteria group bacterium]|nr:hypothetical protein [Patescibacteria group bacterium]